MENQRAFLENVGAQLGVRGPDLSPWYQVGYGLLRKLGCLGLLLGRYDSDVYKMLTTVFPEYQWLPWRFKKVRISPNSIKEDRETIKLALSFIEKECNVAKLQDWYEVSNMRLKSLGLFRYIFHLGGLYQVLTKYRGEEFAWEEERFIGVRHFGQRLLGTLLRKIFKDVEIVNDYELGQSLRVSFYLPSLKLAFDYQEPSLYAHLKSTDKVNVELREDPKKLAEAETHGITLIFIPFWWDRTKSSLLATMAQSDRVLKCLGPKVALGMDPTKSSPIPRTALVRLSNWKKRESE